MKIYPMLIICCLSAIACKTTDSQLDSSKSQNLVSTVMRNALITRAEKGKFLISAHLLAGNNKCLAEGVMVSLLKKNKNGSIYVSPHHNKVGDKICTREFKPVYKKATLVIPRIDDVFLENYKESGKKVPALDLLAVAYVTEVGSCSRKSCPTTTFAVTENGQLSTTQEYYINKSLKIGQVEYAEHKVIRQQIVDRLRRKISEMTYGDLVDLADKTADCARSPKVSYYVTSKETAVLIFQENACKQSGMSDIRVQKIVDEMKKFRQSSGE